MAKSLIPMVDSEEWAVPATDDYVTLQKYVAHCEEALTEWEQFKITGWASTTSALKVMIIRINTINKMQQSATLGLKTEQAALAQKKI